MQPYSVITIGRKTTPYQLVKEMFGYFIIVGFIFLAMLSVLGRHLFTNGIGWVIWLAGTFIFWILFMLINFHEKYYEFQDVDFYIYGHSHQLACYQKGRTLYLNPGSCGKKRFSLPLTYIILDLYKDHYEFLVKECSK